MPVYLEAATSNDINKVSKKLKDMYYRDSVWPGLGEPENRIQPWLRVENLNPLFLLRSEERRVGKEC